MKNPCKLCLKRTITCHTMCKAYDVSGQGNGGDADDKA